jgi:hypothetical protein
MVDISPRSSLIRVRVLEAVSGKTNCNKHRLAKDQIKITVLCNTKEEDVKQKMPRAGVLDDTFCPDSAVTELVDTPGVCEVVSPDA